MKTNNGKKTAGKHDLILKFWVYSWPLHDYSLKQNFWPNLWTFISHSLCYRGINKTNAVIVQNRPRESMANSVIHFGLTEAGAYAHLKTVERITKGRTLGNVEVFLRMKFVSHQHFTKCRWILQKVKGNHFGNWMLKEESFGFILKHIRSCIFLQIKLIPPICLLHLLGGKIKAENIFIMAIHCS